MNFHFKWTCETAFNSRSNLSPLVCKPRQELMQESGKLQKTWLHCSKTLPVLLSKEFNHFKFGVFHALCIFQDCHFGHPLPPERWVHCPNITFRIFSSSLVGQRAPLGMGDVENSWIGLESLPWIWPMSFLSRFPLHVRLHISTYHHICTSTCSTMELRHFSTWPSGRDVSETNTVQTGRDCEVLAKVSTFRFSSSGYKWSLFVLCEI